MTRAFRLISLAIAALILCASPCMAYTWPPSVVGTWDIQANQSPGTLVITAQGQGGSCVAISGTIYQTNVIEGFYCPESGRISFLRKTKGNVTFQVFTGNLSVQAPGNHLWIGGTFAVERSPLGGDFGEYSFLARKE